MKRISCMVFLVSLFVVALSCVVLSGQASALIFNFEITNLSPNTVSPTARITHYSGLDLFDGITGDATGDGAISLFSGTPPPGGTYIITPSVKAIPTSIPAPLFLLGTGLMGLACFNGRKSFKR